MPPPPSRSNRPVTTPALKYGPTGLYGGCEVADCERGARATCGACNGHFCRNHVDHDVHADHLQAPAGLDQGH